jgi:16S rRNA (cytosine1402-N4)-methyltransferase
MVRAASWLVVRAAIANFPFIAGRRARDSTAFCQTTDVRTASGWLSVRRPVTFMAGRKKSLGTELLTSFETMVRAASGWLSARPSQIFLSSQDAALGTARRFVKTTDVRTASGWLSARRPVTFMGGRGTVSFPRIESMARAASGVLFARPSATLYMQSGETPECRALSSAGVSRGDRQVDGGRPRQIHHRRHARRRRTQRDLPQGRRHRARRGPRSRGARPRARAARGLRRSFSTWEGNFSQLLEIPGIQSGGRADGLLLDLGVSSRQLDSAARGFSFMREGPLDMRMGPSSPHTAAEVVNEWDEADLVRILFEFGEEPRARRIASAIVKQRAAKPFRNHARTRRLHRSRHRPPRPDASGDPRVSSHPHGGERGTRIARRRARRRALRAQTRRPAVGHHLPQPGGPLVKRFLRHRSAPFIDDPGWPEPRPNPDYQFELLARKAIAPTAEETSLNPRARSAKLRVARLLDPKP